MHVVTDLLNGWPMFSKSVTLTVIILNDWLKFAINSMQCIWQLRIQQMRDSSHHAKNCCVHIVLTDIFYVMLFKLSKQTYLWLYFNISTIFEISWAWHILGIKLFALMVHKYNCFTSMVLPTYCRRLIVGLLNMYLCCCMHCRVLITFLVSFIAFLN